MAREMIFLDVAKRIVLTILHDVSRRAFVAAVEKRITRNSTPKEMPLLRARPDELERALWCGGRARK